MQYKLVFVKASPQHRLAGVGMGGNVMMVFSMLSNITDQDTLYVDMETNECICTDIALKEKNPWEYYFSQQKLNLNKEVIVKTNQEIGEINFRYSDRTIGENLSLYAPWKNRFYNNFQLKDALSSPVDTFYKNHLKGKVTLGMQVRLTDQKFHHRTHGVIESVIRANEILEENPSIEQVFLATDDSTIIPYVKNSLPVPVVYYEDIFRADEFDRLHDPYDRLNSDRPLHRYLLSLECLCDIFTLTKCDYLLKADLSGMSIVACLLAENINKVYTL